MKADLKYSVRAVKYFFYFTIIFIIIIALLLLTGAAEGDISTMFRGGYSALWKIALIFAVISAVYPSVGFMRKDAMVSGSWEETRSGIREYMESRHYILEKEDTGMMTFRRKDIMSRVTRMYEDRITLSAKLGAVEIEGLRKDVVRIAMGLEHKFRGESE